MRCCLSETSVAGWRAIILESGALRAVVLPDKGADLVELVDVASGVDVLFHAPWGLAPPAAAPREGSDGHAFLANYGGGWQELFPSVNGPCERLGETIPFHGEVATLPWEVDVLRDDGDGVDVRFTVACRTMPFRVERTLSLEPGSTTLVVREAVTNLSARPLPAVWGHHCVVGPPLVAAGARLRVPARTLETIPEMWEETARLEPGQRSEWPHARLRAGGTVDLSEVPGPSEGSHDDVYLTDLEDGWVEVENCKLGLVFRLEFDHMLFRWLISWQPYGGAHAMPLRDAYALGIEPWTSRLSLEEAVEDGVALEVPPGGSVSTRLLATIKEGEESR
jgi:Domain of unknown function (DUF4432)